MKQTSKTERVFEKSSGFSDFAKIFFLFVP